MAINPDIIITNRTNDEIIAKAMSTLKNDRKITANVVEIVDANVSIRSGDTYRIQIIDNSVGIKIYDAKLTGIKGSIVQFENMKYVKMIQRRRDLKIKVLFDGQLIRFTEDYTYTLPIRIINISAGGICFNCREDLSADDRYYYLFDKGGREISLKTQILRKTPISGGFSYGCKFIDMNSNEEESIRRFVFKMQILQKKIEEKGS